MKVCKRGHERSDTETRCLVCRRAATASWQKTHPEKMKSYSDKQRLRAEVVNRNRAATKKWRAQNRAEVNARALAAYYLRKAAGLIECSTEKTRAWKQANPERARQLRVQNEATRRARKAGASGSHTSAEWQAICERQRGLCAACGDECKLTKDHVVPLSMGGSNDAANLQGLCGPCNSRKGARITIDTDLRVKETV